MYKKEMMKLLIDCVCVFSNAGPESPLENHKAQVTCLVYSEPLLLVGTHGGYLLVFCIHRRHRSRHSSIPTTTLHSLTNPATHSLPASPTLSLQTSRYDRGGMGRSRERRLDYRVVCSTHCCTRPVVSIHPNTVQGSTCTVESPYLSSPTHSLSMMVVFGPSSGRSSGETTTKSVVHFYEVTSSPLGSPMTSPQTSVSAGGRRSTTSLPNPSGAGQRCSLQDLTEMPPITIHRVTKGALSYLPLPVQENSAR